MCINVCFAIHDKNGRYTKYLATAIYSVLCNTNSPVMIHVICDGTLSEKNKSKLDEIANKLGGEIGYYDVSKLEFNLNEEQYKRFTIGTLYRLKMIDILPDGIERVIQLDVDVVVNMDLADLYNIDFEDKYLAACVDRTPSRKSIVESGELAKEKYVNVGVVLWNVKKIRGERIDLFNKGEEFFEQHPDVRLPDEEAVNKIFENKIKYLSSEYNYPSVKSRNLELDVGRRIYHFCADVPRDYDTYAVDKLFIETLEKTNWYSKQDLLQHYINRFKEMEIKKENVVSLFGMLDVRKDIIIWGVKGDIHPIIMDLIYKSEKNYTYVDSDADLWGGEYRGEIIKSPDILKRKKDEIVIISTIFRYNEVREVLLKYGYKENIDFFDGKQLLNEKKMAKLWGERFNPWDV